MPVAPMLHSGERERRDGRSATTKSPYGVQQHTDAATLRAGRGGRASLSTENAAGRPVAVFHTRDGLRLGRARNVPRGGPTQCRS